MKIQKVKIKKFKVIENLEQDLNGKNILLIGDNGVGKSSFMQFIEIALGRTDNIPPNAMGEGEVIAIKPEGEFRFVVKMKGGKPHVTVIAPNGLKDDRKSAIAAIVGAIDFDIQDFVSWSETVPGRRKQVELYKSLLPAEIVAELTKYEVNINVTTEERTEVNKKIKNIKGFLKESPLYGAHQKIQPVDVSGLTHNLTVANEKNKQINDVNVRVKERETANERLVREVNELSEKIANMKTELAANETKNKEAKEWLLKPENQLVDTTAITTEINASAEKNKQYNEAQEIVKKETELVALEEEAGEMTALIESTKEAIANAIMDMEPPVPGLSYDTEGLIYKDVPVSSAVLSTSEIIELGCKMKMAQNKEFGVLLIEHGESLGTDRLNLIQQMAEENGWQIIMEQVERGTKELRFEFINDEK
jgi:energy-coupling factor transporter ATP-binding protein EcfA2